jgi:hypothetical protein
MDTAHKLEHLSAREPDSGLVRVVVDTPKGSHISEKPSDAPLAAFSLWYAAFVTASISKGLR